MTFTKANWAVSGHLLPSLRVQVCQRARAKDFGLWRTSYDEDALVAKRGLRRGRPKGPRPGACIAGARNQTRVSAGTIAKYHLLRAAIPSKNARFPPKC